jgi:hypothetical protein
VHVFVVAVSDVGFVVRDIVPVSAQSGFWGSSVILCECATFACLHVFVVAVSDVGFVVRDIVPVSAQSGFWGSSVILCECATFACWLFILACRARTHNSL